MYKRQFQRDRGFSLLELLICIAIIGILFALQMGTFSRAIGKARRTAAEEAARQGYIGRESDNVNAVNPFGEEPASKQACRDAFRHYVDTGRNEHIVSELLYVVRNDDEFRAYFHTMLNRWNGNPPVYEGGMLMARDDDGNVYPLPPVLNSHSWTADRHGSYIIGWDFLSTDLSETTMDGLTVSVIRSSGSIDRIRYPGDFPVTKTVAQLSHRFVKDMQQ
jgi:prepilin-type N-terminal cleavage/methylation domain-containing protein